MVFVFCHGPQNRVPFIHMYSLETISQIHHKLQALDPSALVLLGGSYLYGEAGEESDVDFYLICPLWQLFFLKPYKNLVGDLRKRFPDVDFSLMVVPRWLREHGYYIYGQDVNGKIHSWAVPTSVLVRNCLKLAYFNFLRSKVEYKGIERNIAKTKKQLAVAYMATTGKIDFNKAIFSREYIQSHEASISRLGGVGVGEDNLSQALQQACHQLLSYLTFSWSNYLLYNVRFLLRGNPLFLFKNPDKMIVKRLADGLHGGEDYKKLYQEIKEIIFPVKIL